MELPVQQFRRRVQHVPGDALQLGSVAFQVLPEIAHCFRRKFQHGTGDTGQVHRQCRRDTAGAAAKIQQTGGRLILSQFQHRFHQCFGILPRDQHTLSHLKLQPEEFPCAAEIL